MPTPIELLASESGVELNTLERIRQFDAVQFSRQCTNDERLTLQAMLASLIGDMDTNKKLRNLWHQNTPVLPRYILHELSKLTFLTRNLNQSDLDRVFANFDMAMQGAVLNDDQKISLKEFASLYNLVKLFSILKKWNSLGLIKGNQQLEQLYDSCEKADTIIQSLDKHLNTTFNLPTGGIVFEHAEDMLTTRSVELGFFEKIIAFFALHFVTKFAHVSRKAYHQENPEQEHLVSHLKSSINYKLSKFKFMNYLYSDGNPPEK